MLKRSRQKSSKTIKKTMENVKNGVDLRLATDNKKAFKLFSSIYFKECSYKNLDGLHLIEMYKKEVKYDKLEYVGTTILDLSKLHMMNFHYGVIHKNFEDYNLVYSDTDSLVYSIKTDDIYEWIKNSPKYFDLSDSLRIDMKDNTNKKVLGMFKDELQTLVMREFTALSPKVYSYIQMTIEEAACYHPSLYTYDKK